MALVLFTQPLISRWSRGSRAQARGGPVHTHMHTHNSSLGVVLNVSLCKWVVAVDTYGGVGLRDFAACRRRSGERDLERDLERERLPDLDLERLRLLKDENAKQKHNPLRNNVLLARH